MVTRHRPGIPVLSSARERLKTLLDHDEALRKRVREAIGSVPSVSADDIAFRIWHDIVVIEGELPSKEVRHQLLEAIGRVRGVRGVESHLVAKS